MPLDTTSLAALLEALRNWLIENPNGDIQEFADEHRRRGRGPGRRLAGQLRAGRLQPQLRPGHEHDTRPAPRARSRRPPPNALGAAALRLEPEVYHDT